MTSVQHTCGLRFSQAWKACGFPNIGVWHFAPFPIIKFSLVFIFQLHECTFVYKFCSPISNPNFAIVFIRINLKQNDTLSLSLLELKLLGHLVWMPTNGLLLTVELKLRWIRRSVQALPTEPSSHWHIDESFICHNLFQINRIKFCCYYQKKEFTLFPPNKFILVVECINTHEKKKYLL